ncbi:MAG: energy-coupling factor transporter ATPase [Caldicoprobacterales bacterium]
MSIIIENLTHVYMEGGPFESTALDGINLEIKDGEFIGLIGHTGSGKSTLVQHLNGLLKPTSGTVRVDDIIVESKSKNLKDLRRKVGLVFQYPEHQLFEEKVYLDIAFGPKNLGCSDTETELRVREAMELVGLDYESIKDRSPFELSGGQRRRVAIAGVLAMKPKVLILDEPTAGLDPRGRDEILGRVAELHRRYGITIILVSHSMEDVAKLVDRIIVMNKGKIALDGPPGEVFKYSQRLDDMGLAIPSITRLMKHLRASGMDVPEDVFTVAKAKEAVLKALRRDSDA